MLFPLPTPVVVVVVVVAVRLVSHVHFWIIYKDSLMQGSQ